LGPEENHRKNTFAPIHDDKNNPINNDLIVDASKLYFSKIEFVKKYPKPHANPINNG
jgi:hypothetical protein